MPASAPAPAGGVVGAAARLADRMRWFFLPVALCALVAVGTHVAADVVGERILWLVDAVDKGFDALAGRWELTAPLVDLVGPAQRTWMARAAALIWELAADALLALAMLGYDEHADEVARFRQLARKALARPTTLRIVRPLATAAVALSGSCAVARLLEGTLYLGLRGPLGTLSGPLSRATAVAAMAGLVGFIAWRAVVHALVQADALSESKVRTRARALTAGLPGAILLLPLALAALRAAPLLSFLR